MARLDMDEIDSLEGWVAVKDSPFTDAMIPPRMTFLVCWNDVCNKVAVTCRLHSRVASDNSNLDSRTGIFSMQELRAIHELLCLIHPSLHSYLPYLPEESRSVWAYLGYQEPPIDYELVCTQLEEYFTIALEVCKEKLLMSTLFEEHTSVEYFENVSELRRQGFLDEIARAEDELETVIFMRKNATNMHEMGDVYQQEDDAMFRLNVALSAYYNYVLQPFLDLREIAYTNVTEAKSYLQNPDVGDRIKREYGAMFTEWQGHYEDALDNIQKTYVEYYSKTCGFYQAIVSRMLHDEKQFGKTSFELIGRERLLRVQEDLSLERLQMLQNEKKIFVQERDKVKEEIASIDEHPGTASQLKRLEEQVFSWQVSVYAQQLSILEEEERLAKNQLAAITRQIKDKEDEVVFYDAVEDVKELSPDESGNQRNQLDPRVVKINAKRMSIQKRRAKIRNMKTNLEVKKKDKEQKKMEEIDTFKQHHAVHLKREQRKEEENKKQDFVQEQRRKAIDRIKNHKFVCICVQMYTAPVASHL